LTVRDRTPRIVIFDSGVGSLSIGAEIHALLPSLDLLYVMDRGGFPYGLWQEQALVEHICQKVHEVLRAQSADMLVMACNSASTAVLPALREQLSIPVVGVVPAIKPAAAQSRSRVIGLLATPGTVARPYTAKLIADFAPDCCVIPVGSAELAPAVEALFWHGDDAPQVWRGIAEQFHCHPRAAEMDTVVLACTHFPLVKDQLARQLPKLAWIDSGQAIARRVQQLLLGQGWQPTPVPGRQFLRLLGAREPSEVLSQRLGERGIVLSGH